MELEEHDYSGEFGLVGNIEQQDETAYYNSRSSVLLDSNHDNYDEEDGSRDGKIIHFSKRKLYGREKELAQLHDTFQRNLQTEQAEIIFLSGYSGSGKSALVQEFVQQIIGSNGNQSATNMSVHVIMGKYQELRLSDPFGAIANALSRWCKSLSRQEMKDLGHHCIGTSEQGAGELSQKIGDDVSVLLDLVPELSCLLIGEATDKGKTTVSDKTKNRDDGHVPVPSQGVKKDTGRGSPIGSGSNHLSQSQQGPNKTRLQYCVHSFLQCICSHRPIIMHLDDLQWADDASLELLLSILSADTGSSSLPSLLFIGSYRSNAVYEDHPLTALMNDLKEKLSQSQVASSLSAASESAPGTMATNLQFLDLPELSRVHVQEFLADTLGYEPEQRDEIAPLSDAIFHKTLGNMFYVMQATEELVRKNVLYYDSVIFAWQWNLQAEKKGTKSAAPRDVETSKGHIISTKSDFSKFQGVFSEGILDMVRSKIEHMPDLLALALVVASHVRAIFDANTLLHILSSWSDYDDGTMQSDTPSVGEKSAISKTMIKHLMSSSHTVTKEDLVKNLDRAVYEGLLLREPETEAVDQEYKFGHDMIQEASRSFVQGEDRNQLLFRVGHALALLGSNLSTGQDWMLFTAAHHLNSVPRHHHKTVSNKIKVMELNLRTARLSTGVAGFDEAVGLLRAGVAILDSAVRWSDEYYDLTLEMFNLLLRTELNLGNYELLKPLITEVLENGRTLRDKSSAFFSTLVALRQEREHDVVVETGISILQKFGVDIPDDLEGIPPEEANANDRISDLSLEEKADLISSSKYAEDETILVVIDKILGSSTVAGKFMVSFQLGQVALEFCMAEGVSEYLPRILVHSCHYYRKHGTPRQSYDLAIWCQEMLDQIPGVTPSTYCNVGLISNSIAMQLRPIRMSLATYYECYRQGIRAGDTEWAFLAAVAYGTTIYACGHHINSLMEAKYALLEEECKRFHQPQSVSVVLSILRQMTINILGKSDNPLVFDGKAMTEATVLSYFQEGTASFTQTKRDLSILKVMLGCVLDDADTMKVALDFLKTLPDFDLAQHRGFMVSKTPG